MTLDARRIEELTLNSSAPPGQLLYDGWLLRLSPGKAKRARSVNAIYPSRLVLADKVTHCERLYARARLPAIFRITPFSEPADLDSHLAARGYGRFDETAVEATLIDGSALQASAARPLELTRWVHAVGDLRGSAAEHRIAHLARLEGLPLALHAVVLEEQGRVVATGLAMVEDDCAGLFDIVTDPAQLRRGHARQVVSALLRAAQALGARHAYLQVVRDNVPARRLYSQFGFREQYLYWYRGRVGEQH